MMMMMMMIMIVITVMMMKIIMMVMSDDNNVCPGHLKGWLYSQESHNVYQGLKTHVGRTRPTEVVEVIFCAFIFR